MVGVCFAVMSACFETTPCISKHRAKIQDHLKRDIDYWVQKKREIEEHLNTLMKLNEKDQT